MTEYDRLRDHAQASAERARTAAVTAEVYAALTIAAALQDIAFALRGVPGWAEPNG